MVSYGRYLFSFNFNFRDRLEKSDDHEDDLLSESVAKEIVCVNNYIILINN